MAKRKSLILTAIVTAVAFAANIVAAPTTSALEACKCDNPIESNVLGNCEYQGKKMYCDQSGEGKGIKNLLIIGVNILLAGVIVAGTIGIIVSGVTIMTAREDEAQVAKAKKRILDIVIGIAAFALFWLLINLLLPAVDKSIINTDTSGMNQEGPGGGPNSTKPKNPNTTPTNPNSTPSNPTNPSNPTDPSNPVNPIGPSDPNAVPSDPNGTVGWNERCGPNPTKKINNAVDGDRTLVYRNSTGRVFYKFYQGGEKLWSDKPADTSGTMSSRGCYRTSIAVMFRSFGMTNITPRDFSTSSGGMSVGIAASKFPSYKNYFTYHVYGNNEAPRSGPAFDSSKVKSWKNTIISALKSGGGIIFRIRNYEGGNSATNSWTSYQHSMPVVDYKKSGGQDLIYVLNTYDKEGKVGWFDLDAFLKNKKINLVEFITFLPNPSINCN